MTELTPIQPQYQLELLLKMAEELEPQLKTSRQLEILNQLEAQYPNFQQALQYAWQSGQAELALRLANALMWFWFLRGYISQGREWFDKILGLDTSLIVPTVKAKAFFSAGWLCFIQRDFKESQSLSQQALELYQQLGDEGGRAMVLVTLGLLDYNTQQYHLAETKLKESLAFFKRVGDKWWVRHITGAGYIFNEMGRYEEATAWLNESLALAQQLADKDGLAWALLQLARTQQYQGHYKLASDYLKRSLELNREVGSKLALAHNLAALGQIELSQGNLEEAKNYLEESLRLWYKLERKADIANTLSLLEKISVSPVSVSEEKPGRV